MVSFTFGLDISHHQDLALDLARAKREGISFVILKSTEGSSFVDSEFKANLQEARGAGLYVAAYHYVRTGSVSAQIENISRVVPRDIPVIPDVESGSGNISHVWQFVAALRRAGYHVPLLYLPRWYWQQIGSPSLVGLPPLWSSRYPDNIVGSLSDEFADVPDHYWDGYGGLSVALLQFTSSVRIAGHQPIDANAFRGTVDELAELLGYNVTHKEGNMRDLILAQEVGGPKVWVGDGTFRRHVATEQELTDLQHWIKQQGGNSTLNKDWANLPVLGIDIVTFVKEEVGKAVKEYLEANPPQVEVPPVDYDKIGQVVVAEFKKEGN